MKIGIFTYFEGCNFGMNLQAYTSQQYFESLGHDVWIINYAKNLEHKNLKKYPSRQVDAHQSFVEKRLHLTKMLSQIDIVRFIKENQFDVVAFGADAVWNKRDRVDLAVYSAQWLNDVHWDKELRVIGLSPAFMGTTYSDLTEIEKENFRKGVLNFTFPNVRDVWTRDIVNREIMGCDYIKTINPDPVFLLNELCTDSWNPIWSDVKSKRYFILSLPPYYSPFQRRMMEKWLKKLKVYLNKQGYKLIELPIPDGESKFQAFDYTIPYPIDPLQWYLWIKNAKGFIGLRFHAVVSCLSAGTPFFSLDIYGNVPRWLNYMNRLGFHKFDRELNKRSKIRNLIEGSGLEEYRINGDSLFSLSPKRLIDKLETCDTTKIIDFRDKNIAIFKKNMDDALNSPIDQSNK